MLVYGVGQTNLPHPTCRRYALPNNEMADKTVQQHNKGGE